MTGKPSLLFFTNLHPLPWQPTRATYNGEETKYLSEHYEIKKLIPVPWFVWLKKVVLEKHRVPDNTCIFPFLYVPKVLTSLHPLMMIISIIVSLKPLLWLIRANRVIASWSYAEGVTAAFFKKISKGKLIIETLGSDVNALMEKPFHRAQMRWAFNNADVVTGKSIALVKAIANHAPKTNTSVVYNGVDFNTFSLRPRPIFQGQQVRLLFIGSLIKTKGIEELIDAMTLMKKNVTSIVLDIIGDGELIEKIRYEVKVNKLNENINILGSVPHDQLLPYLHNADALILPSYREGVPNVVMESLATGTPVIVTKVGGIPEVVTDCSNGVFIDDLNSQGIVEAVYKLTQSRWNPEVIRSSILQFTWSNTADQIRSLLEKNE
ncbi:glycosyltransferase [Alteromonas abrolhosensis]|uniref:glycosyltransferase n=1 Tax=Alteromonas abrolhosensis TaxID=1892904 RepID=UPI003517A1FD